MVLRRCRALLKDEEKARDAMQDVFVKLIRNQATLKGDYPSSLLYTMATNTCLNVLRYHARRPESAGDEILMAIAKEGNPEQETESKNLLDRIFKREKPSTKTIAVLHYVDGFTLEEVAQKSGLSVSGVRKRLRILKQNVEQLKEVSHV